jgi:hypothetical protein
MAGAEEGETIAVGQSVLPFDLEFFGVFYHRHFG